MTSYNLFSEPYVRYGRIDCGALWDIYECDSYSDMATKPLHQHSKGGVFAHARF